MVDVAHPLGFLCHGRSIDCERFAWALYLPAVIKTVDCIVRQCLKCDVLQLQYVLPVVLLFAYNNASIDKNIIEKEKLSWFQLFATHFCQDSFTDQDSIGNGQWLARTAKTLLHEPNPLGICI